MPIAPVKQLIVVDDDLLYTRLVELVLKSLKFDGDTRIFHNPVDLMSFLTTPTSQPTPPLRRLVLLDLNMPQMNGLSVLKTVRTDPRTAATPIVVMSGILGNSEIRDCFKDGANSCMHKPDELDGFFTVFDKLLHYWFTLSSIPVQ